MAKRGSQSAFLFVDGYDFLAPSTQGFSHKIESLTERTDGMTDAPEIHTPVGMTRILLSQQGAFFDTAARSSHEAISGSLPSTPAATHRATCCGFNGHDIGAMFYGLEGDLTNVYEVLGALKGLTKVNAEHKISGACSKGHILQPVATKSADWDTESTSLDYASVPQRVIPITSNSQADPTVVTCPVPHGLTTGDVIVISGVVGSDPDINGEQTVTVIDELTFSVAVDTSAGSAGTGGSFVRANSANGGVSFLQVFEFDGLDDVVVKVRDSADDITYADLVTHATVTTAPVVERKTVAGTIDRYLAVDGDVTGTGSVRLWVGFARN